MRISCLVHVLKIEERFIKMLDRIDYNTGEQTWSDHSAGWWALLETHPPISIYLGEERPEGFGDTLVLTLEPPK